MLERETYRAWIYKTISQVKLGTSEPIGSVEFRRFLNYRIPVRISSDQFPSVSPIFDEFRAVILRNLTEFFRRNPGRNPVVRKTSELNGADRKATESTGSDVGSNRFWRSEQ